MKGVLSVFALLLQGLFCTHTLAQRCVLDITYSTPNTPIKHIELNEGLIETLNIQNIKTLKNTGNRDALLLLQNKSSADAWHRLNPEERYSSPTQLKRIRCLDSHSDTRNTAEIAMALINKEANAIWQSALDFTHSLAGEYGKASHCNEKNYGNQFDGSRGKFKNFLVTHHFKQMNNYLAMQAANKTYFQQFDFNGRYPTSEAEYRCAANELYTHWGFEHVYFINSVTSGNLIVAATDKWVLISVRGTQIIIDETEAQNDNALINSLTDLFVNGPSAPFPASQLINNSSGLLHSGYASVVGSLMPLIKRSFDEMGLHEKPVFITGHSLGGAIASVLAYKMKTEKYNIQAAYTYASPKIGNKEFMQHLENALTLYSSINYRDPVPDYPKVINFLDLAPQHYGAKHVSYFTKNHNVIEFKNSKEDFSRRNTIRQDQGKPIPLIASFTDNIKEWHFHYPNFYTAFLYRNLLEQKPKLINNTAIQPEYQKQIVCLDGRPNRKRVEIGWHDDEENYTQWLFDDTNGYPVQECDEEE